MLPSGAIVDSGSALRGRAIARRGDWVASAHRSMRSGVEAWEETLDLLLGEAASLVRATRRVLVKRPAPWALEQQHTPRLVTADLRDVPVEAVSSSRH